MLRRIVVFVFFDLVLLFSTFLVFSDLSSSLPSINTPLFWITFIILSGSWIVWSLLFGKYTFASTQSKEKVVFSQIKINTLFFLLAYILLLFIPTLFSRPLFAAYIFIISSFEYLFSYLYLLDKSLNRDMEELALFSRARKGQKDTIFPVYDIKTKKGKQYEILKEQIIQECGENHFQYIKAHIPITDKDTLIVSTSTRFNIHNQPRAYYQNIVNLKKLNDTQYINKFLEEVNAKLNYGGIFLGMAETYNLRKQRILKKFPWGINWMYYSLDFLVKRLMPKLLLTKKLYFFITGGRNRVMSRAEILGRLYSCGFQVQDEGFLSNRFFFIVRKIELPKFDLNPTYGPFVKLRRYGKNKKIIGVYKMRTMHAYSEYLQAYVYEKNDLQKGGKFKNDFRVTSIGRIMRKFWIDELPMFLNVLKGEMKLVGVRPLSPHYFDLYSEELQTKRLKYKPGLIPPFYVDLPKTLKEIMASEMRYLDAYEKHPLRTDIRYFYLAFYNILFKNARSK